MFGFLVQAPAYEDEFSGIEGVRRKVNIGFGQIFVNNGGWITEIKIGRSVADQITVNFPYNPAYIAKNKTIQRYR